MPAWSTGRLVVVFVVLAAACVGAIAFAAAAKHRPVVHPRPLKYACASARFNTAGVLQYAARPSACRGRNKRLVNFVSGRPVYTCRKEHGHRRTLPRRLLAHAAVLRH